MLQEGHRKTGQGCQCRVIEETVAGTRGVSRHTHRRGTNCWQETPVRIGSLEGTRSGSSAAVAGQEAGEASRWFSGGVVVARWQRASEQVRRQPCSSRLQGRWCIVVVQSWQGSGQVTACQQVMQQVMQQPVTRQLVHQSDSVVAGWYPGGSVSGSRSGSSNAAASDRAGGASW